ncbi:MAG: porphobilinogen synthase [Nitrososphaerales archaeon]
MTFPYIRMRRLRRTSKLRDLLQDIVITTNDLIYPIFVKDGIKNPEPIDSMPGQFRYPLDKVPEIAKRLASLKIPAMMIFGIPSKKDDLGSSAFDKNGIVQKAVASIKRSLGDEMIVITDVCLCQYTSHNHCGIVKNGEVLNDETLEVLQKIAESHAEAGADIVAPSSMMDGQVQAIRKCLDEKGFSNIAIMAYSAKFASSFYGPFRNAVYSSPKFGDRKGYQMNYHNPREALREVELDIKEGADIVMVKPALAYLDLIHRIKEKFNYPIAAYNVSGEYSMIKSAAKREWLDEKSAVLEILTSMKRAGADMIITYFAIDAANWLIRDEQT